MKFIQTAIAAAAIVAAFGAHASLVTSVIGASDPGATFLSISGTSIGGNALVGDGKVLSASDSTDTMPVGTVGKFLSTEGSQVSTLAFTSPTDYLSFLWGTPDSYNELAVLDGTGLHYLSASSFGLSTTGTSSSQDYVQLMDSSGIKAVTFYNYPSTNSFEVANFSVTPVPEPETYALMLGGLGLVGFMARRRRA